MINNTQTDRRDRTHYHVEFAAVKIRDGNRTEPEPNRTFVVPEPEQNSNLANSELGSGGECNVPDLGKTNGEL